MIILPSVFKDLTAAVLAFLCFSIFTLFCVALISLGEFI
jgi:hypothetical protein